MDAAPHTVVGDFHVTKRLVSLTTLPAAVCGANPDRVYLAIITDGTSNTYIAPAAFGSNMLGYLVSTASNTREFTFAQYPSLINESWQAYSAAPSSVWIIEIEYHPGD